MIVTFPKKFLVLRNKKLSWLALLAVFNWIWNFLYLKYFKNKDPHVEKHVEKFITPLKIATMPPNQAFNNLEFLWFFKYRKILKQKNTCILNNWFSNFKNCLKILSFCNWKLSKFYVTQVSFAFSCYENIDL